MGTRIALLALGDATEALALRAVLESMHHTVDLVRIGAPADVAPALRAASVGHVTMISAHGGPRGFYMGRFGDDIDTSIMAGDWLPVTAAFDGVTFGDDAVLFCTACGTRENGLLQVLLNAGGHLIAPDGYPDGGIVVPWIGACLSGAENGLAHAVKSANALVAPHNRFSYG